MPPLKVDSDELRAFVSGLEGVEGELAGVGENLSDYMFGGYSFPGTDLDQVLTGVTGDIETAVVDYGDRLYNVSQTAKGNGENYDMTEADFASRLGQLKLEK